MAVGGSEDEFLGTFLHSLKDRGLSGVQLVISDQHRASVTARTYHSRGNDRRQPRRGK